MSLAHFQYVVATILPVFLVIGLGYAAFKKGILPEGGHKVMAAFVFNFGTPAAIFSALSTKSLDEIWNTDYIMAYTLGSLLAFTLVAVGAMFLLKKDATSSVILGLGGSFSNSLLIGFPIIFFLLGSSVLVPFSLTLVVENLIMLPLILILADLGVNPGQANISARFKETLLNTTKNPIVLSIVFGMAFSALQIPLPQVATRMVDMLAGTVTGVALFTIGGGLVGVRMSGLRQEVGIVVLGKLLIHPLALFLTLFVWFEVEAVMGAVAVILASMPMFGVYAVIGQKYNMGGLCSAVLLPTTLFAMVTVSVITTLALMFFNL